MWKTCYEWEPMELRILKNQLANLECKCDICEKAKKPNSLFYDRIQHQRDVTVQSDDGTHYYDHLRVPCNTCANNMDVNNINNTLLNSIQKGAICPSCVFTLNLLQSGFIKNVKDEQSETNTEMFKYDKSTENVKTFLNRTTSVTGKPIVKYSDLSLCDFISESTIENSAPVQTNVKKRNNHDRVTFMGLEDENAPLKLQIFEDCVCLEDIIEAIRPPLVDM